MAGGGCHVSVLFCGQLTHWFLLRRAHCTQAHGGADVASDEELVIWVPGRLLHAASRDPDLAQHLVESLFRPGALPPKLPAASAARQWAAIHMNCTPPVRDDPHSRTLKERFCSDTSRRIVGWLQTLIPHCFLRGVLAALVVWGIILRADRGSLVCFHLHEVPVGAQERGALMLALKARAVLQHAVRTLLELRGAQGEAAADARWPQVRAARRSHRTPGHRWLQLDEM